MAWQLFATVLAAWGLLCALWAGFGWLLTGSRPVTLVVLYPTEGILARLRWLDRMGLLRCRIIAAEAEVSMPLCHDDQIEHCTLAALSARIEAERKQID